MLIYQGKNQKIIEATQIANKLLNNHNGFYASVRNAKYTHANCTSRQIADAIQKIHIKYDIKIAEYYKWNPLSSEQAYFTPKKPLQINLNKWKSKNKSKHDFVESIVHEFCHVVDNQYMHLEFGHTFNKTADRNDTAPYKIGFIAGLLSEAYYK